MAKQITLLLLSLTILAYGKGTIHLPRNQMLYWSFPDENSVKFEYHCPMSLMEDDYDWVGIGFKDIMDGGDMRNADIVMINLHDGRIDDYWSFMNSKPESDIKLGGLDSLAEKSVNAVDKYKMFSWSKPLNTGDKYDKMLAKNAKMNFIWAYGRINSQGNPKKHLDENKGSWEIVLSEDYTDEEEIFLI
ncbi:unnamed protein product [Blepharisma stoltei]|uniref:DOMON domain-containing protein n=1 Tax=Blepharisma stoltei TaxID=1481888 RepID=A0AAU9J6R0_9CILI|nr:unnamed protein product [Blepharisma stoltei]